MGLCFLFFIEKDKAISGALKSDTVAKWSGKCSQNDFTKYIFRCPQI